MSSQSELNKAYARARRNAMSRMKTAEKKYGIYFGDLIPDRPKHITQGSINRLNKLTVDYVKNKYKPPSINSNTEINQGQDIDESNYEHFQSDYGTSTQETQGHYESYYEDTETFEVFPVSRKEFLLNKLFSYSNQFDNANIGERWNDIIVDAVEERGEWEVAKIMDDPENEELIENIFTEIHESYEDKPWHPRVAVLLGKVFNLLKVEVPLQFVELFVEDGDYDADYNSSGMMGEYDERFR